MINKNFILMIAIMSLSLLQITAQSTGSTPGNLTNSSLNLTNSSDLEVNVSNATKTILEPNTTNVTYAVYLANGNASLTNVVIDNAAQLRRQGITVTLNLNSGIPDFLGYATITVAGSTPPGIYNISFNATGGDPSGQPTVVQIAVINQAILNALKNNQALPYPFGNYTGNTTNGGGPVGGGPGPTNSTGNQTTNITSITTINYNSTISPITIPINNTNSTTILTNSSTNNTTTSTGSNNLLFGGIIIVIIIAAVAAYFVLGRKS